MAPTPSAVRRSPRLYRTPSDGRVLKACHRAPLSSLQATGENDGRDEATVPTRVPALLFETDEGDTESSAELCSKGPPFDSPDTEVTPTQVINDTALTQNEGSKNFENSFGLTKVFSFLSDLKKDDLRKIARLWGLKTSGNKSELIYRCFLFLKDCEDNGKSMFSKIAMNKHCPSYEDFVESRELGACDWITPPSVSIMKDVLLKAGDKFAVGMRPLSALEYKEQQAREKMGNGGESGGESTPNFTLSEFARMVLIRRDDEKVRRALFSMDQELSRATLDAGGTRDAFWGIIEGRFNDASVLARASFEGTISDVNPSAPPLCHRCADVLKHQFRDAKGIFTKAIQNWMTSGQNDPEKFVDFLPRNGQNLYANGKRALVMFVVARMGTPYEDTSFVKMASKTIWEGGCEAGMSQMGRGWRSRNSSSPQGGGEYESYRGDNWVKASKRNSLDLADVINQNLGTMKDLVSTLSNPAETNGQVVSTSATPGISLVNSWKENDSMWSIVESARMGLERARKLDDGGEFIEMAEIRYNKALQDWRRLFGNN